MAPTIAKITRPWYKSRGTAAASFAVAVALYLAIQTPVGGGAWRYDHERAFFAELSGRSLTINNIRNFRHDDLSADNGQEYLSRTWHLDDLERVWFGLSHFGPYGLAHSFLSLEFSDGEYLGISIEARMRPGQRYRPLVGMFRQYTKVYVAATERDVIGLRSHARRETVYLYPVTAAREEAEKFVLALVDDANAAYETPEFYNTILDNCLTNLLKHGSRLSEVSAADIRVLLPGRTDQLTYAFGITPDDIPYDFARRRALVDPTLGGLDHPDFSSLLRCGWNGYAGLSFTACR